MMAALSGTCGEKVWYMLSYVVKDAKESFTGEELPPGSVMSSRGCHMCHCYH